MSEEALRELVTLASRGVAMVTEISTDHADYSVVVGPSPLCDGSVSVARVVAWKRRVEFGPQMRFRAGGPAFRLAAIEQERVARAYLDASKGVQ